MHARTTETPLARPTPARDRHKSEPAASLAPDAVRRPRGPDSGPAPKVLVELLACLEGYSGIPQETRLVYKLLAAAKGLEVSGLLNTYAGARVPLTPSRPPKLSTPAKRALAQSRSRYRQAKMLIALDRSLHDPKARSLLERYLRKGDYRWHMQKLLYLLGFKDRGEVLEIDPKDFGDALWTQLFEKTLDAGDREPILSTRFFASTVSQDVAAYFCRSERHAQFVNTKGWDFFVCQKGCPYRLAPETRAVVRYHDAIPVFYPHTISDQNFHLKRHYDVLRASIARGAFFACVTEPVREDLLRLAPEAETSSAVVPDIVSPAYQPAPRPKETLAEILAMRECPISQVRQRSNLTARIRRLVADPHLDRYIMAVSTLEPRKNYGLLLQAFEEANRRAERPFRLVMVANPGWRYDDVLEEIKRLVAAGSVLHLARVPIDEMRILYSNAHAVICPSRSEGFDLSGVEAMLCDTPVLASDIPVHRWVYGEAAHYFDTYDAPALSRSLVELMGQSRDEGALAELRDRGRRQAQLYTPGAIGPKWEALFERLTAEKRDGGGAAAVARRAAI